jgi:hypothetical protein
MKTDIVMLEEQAAEFRRRADTENLHYVSEELRFRKTDRGRRLLVDVLTWLVDIERKDSEKRVRDLETRLKAAELRGQAAEMRLDRNQTDGAAAYARVGLHPGCPDFVLTAARRAFRKAYHPDGQEPGASSGSARQFQEFESIFDRLEQSRNMR